MFVFLDTEFLKTTGGPRFISAALVSDDGRELYAELPLGQAQPLLAQHPNEFVETEVLPQLGRRAGVPWGELPTGLAEWIRALGAESVEVAYDFSTDYVLIEQLLHQVDPLPAVFMLPTHIGYVLGDEDGEAAAIAVWHSFEQATGLKRHHALADAHALRARFHAVYSPQDVARAKRSLP